MKKDIDILKHMEEDVIDILNFVVDYNLESFSKNPLVRKAVCMSLINIGELKEFITDYLKP